MRNRLLVAILVALLVAGVGVVRAVTWGQPDGQGHPYVGTLLFLASDGYLYSCSGTLLSSNVMVTAGHCTSSEGVPNLRTWVSFEPSITYAGREKYGSWIEYLDKEWITATAIPHPQYNDYAQFPNTYDVGVVLLDKGVRLGTYGALPPLGLLDLAVKQPAGDRLFTVVGYGMQGYLKPFYGDAYDRYVGSVQLLEVNSTNNGDQQSAKFSNNPGGGNGSGGTCFGDSGGPVFYGSTNMVSAVVSWGITPCIGVDYQFRLDTPVAQNFVKQYLK